MKRHRKRNRERTYHWKIEFPAHTMCDKVDKGIACPEYNSPEGCPFLHPADGMEKNREKRNAQEEMMK